MIIRRTGEVAPGLHLLGSPAIPCYPLDAPRPVLMDAGVSCLAHSYIQQARAVLGQRRLEHIVLSHSHFDHCGAAALLRQALGGRIAASAKVAAIAARPNAQALIAKLNQEASALAASLDPDWAGGDQFQPFGVDLVLADGDELDMGDGLTLQVIATPGHTWDMLSYYQPQRGVLLASEAVGCPDVQGNIVTEFLVDYDAYLDSIRRLAALDVKVLCNAHHGVYTGDDARAYMERAPRAAEEWRQWVEELLDAQHGDVERVMELVRQREYDPRPQPKQPVSAYMLNLRSRVEHLAQRDRG